MSGTERNVAFPPYEQQWFQNNTAGALNMLNVNISLLNPPDETQLVSYFFGVVKTLNRNK